MTARKGRLSLRAKANMVIIFLFDYGTIGAVRAYDFEAARTMLTNFAINQ